MEKEDQTSLGNRLFIAFTVALVGGIGILVVEAFHYYLWGISWVEADSFPEYVMKIWFLPVGVAVVLWIIGCFKGEAAIELVSRIWDKPWW